MAAPLTSEREGSGGPGVCLRPRSSRGDNMTGTGCNLQVPPSQAILTYSKAPASAAAGDPAFSG
jgi:hypothetical protein